MKLVLYDRNLSIGHKKTTHDLFTCYYGMGLSESAVVILKFKLLTKIK